MVIRAAAVLGAGSMGAQVAALLASIGVEVLVLDVSPKAARDGVDRLKKASPGPFFTPDAATLIHAGGFDDSLPRLASCDWIIEAVVERADAKRALLAAVDAVRRPGCLVTTNTSALSVAALAEGRSDDFRRHWFGTHFFNPPRYLRLLEVIPGPETDPAVVARFRDYADRRLGKGVVVSADSPGFIANRIGVFGVLRVLDALVSGGYSIPEIDELTGPLIGRPKSATFRTLDLAGIDVFARVAGTLAASLPGPDDRAAFTLPPLVDELVRRGWLGEKTGQGFYKKVKRPDGSSEILVLDPDTFEYRPAAPVSLPAAERAWAAPSLADRLRLLHGEPGRVGAFMRATLDPLLRYAAEVAPGIASGIDDVDRAMRWGFGWELGPFEMVDAIGLPAVVANLAGAQPPRLLREALENGRATIREAPLPPAGEGCELLRSARDRSSMVRTNASASLIDLGDGVLAVEFHSKMNTLDADAVAMLRAGVEEASQNFHALVVGNEAPNFSAGANLFLVLTAAQKRDWDAIDRMVRTFQQAALALKYADVPVIAAPAGLALGGGCELCLHADRVQAAAETYMGLVEVGVGLIPAGGGTKEMLIRCLEHRPASMQGTLLPFVRQAFDAIAFARVSASGPDAVRLGYLRRRDGVTMNRDRLIADAKARALARVAEGYQPPVPPRAIPVGGESVLAALNLGVHLAWRSGRISDHDARVGRALAGILAGGALPHATVVPEQYLLDLEREAFLSLCGEPKTVERIAYTLKTGKSLKN